MTEFDRRQFLGLGAAAAAAGLTTGCAPSGGSGAPPDLVVVNGQVAGFNPSQQFSPRDQQNFIYTGDGPGAGQVVLAWKTTLGLR